MKCTREALDDLIKEKYGSVPKMAAAIGKSPQTIYTCLSGLLIGSHFTTSLPIIAALDLDPYELLDHRMVRRSAHDRGYVNIPLYGSVSAGALTEPMEYLDSVPIPAEKHEEYPDAFLLKVSGKSMNLAFPNGILVLVDPCTHVDYPGQPYVACEPGEGSTIKRAFPLDNGLELHPYSSDITMKPVVYDYDTPEGTEVRIVGRVVWGFYPLDWRFDPNAR